MGLALYFFGPRGYNAVKDAADMGAVMKEPFTRFFGVEHITGMLIAIILIHVGKAQARKRISDRAKHKRTLIFYLIALLLILATIPWPFRQIGAGSHWF